PLPCTTFIRLEALSISSMRKCVTSLIRKPLPYSKPITPYSFKVSPAANNEVTSCWLMILGRINCFCGYNALGKT
ncbi:MAG: hypothetical protein ABIQ00_09800, partial [Chitinophagaceae bacterium]